MCPMSPTDIRHVGEPEACGASRSRATPGHVQQRVGAPGSRIARAVAAVVVGAAVMAVAGPALAHPGHGEHGETAFAAGLLHPLTGLDHLLVIIAVGALAVLLPTRPSLWLLPAALIGGMAAGGGVGLALGRARVVDLAIAASVLVLGVALALAVRHGRSAVPVVALLVVTAGAVHGYGHAAGRPAGPTVDYAVGILVVTAALLVAGVAAGVGLRRVPALRVVAGSFVTVAGVAFLAGA